MVGDRRPRQGQYGYCLGYIYRVSTSSHMSELSYFVQEDGLLLLNDFTSKKISMNSEISCINTFKLESRSTVSEQHCNVLFLYVVH